MPRTIEELEAAIQDTESEANSMLFLNQNVLQEYQNRQREVSNYAWLIHAGQLAMIGIIGSIPLKDPKVRYIPLPPHVTDLQWYISRDASWHYNGSLGRPKKLIK
jgi:hypothetical protein